MKKITKLDKHVLQEAVKEYKISRTLQFRERLTNALSTYVYFFPLYCFNIKDDDLLSSFYTHFLEKLDDVVSKYDSSKSSFYTFLIHVLNNLWLNFKRDLRKDNALHDQFHFSENGLDAASVASREETKDDDVVVEHLFKYEKNEFNLVVLKLYYFDFFTEDDLSNLSIHSGKDYKDCLNFIEELMEELAENRRRQSFYESRMLTLHQKIIQQKVKEHVEEHSDEELKKTQSMYLKRYRAVRVYPSYDGIASFMGVSRVKVSNIVHQFKLRVKKKAAGVYAAEVG